MRTFLSLLSSLLVILLLCSPLCAQQPPAAQVKISRLAKTMSAPTETFSGTVYFDRISDLSSEISGRADNVLFREGETVTKGQPLVELNTDFIHKEMARIQAMIELSQAQLERAEKDLNRYQQLLAQQATSATAYDQLFYTVAEIRAQQAAYRAELEAEQLKLQKSILRAPFAALVLNKNIDVGNWLTPGSAVARLGALSDVFVQVPVNEKLLPFSHAGETVQLWLPATASHTTGLHKGFRPLADGQSKNLYVRIQPEAIARPFENMSADVTLATGPQTEQLLVPRDALVTFNGQRFIYTVKEQKAALVPVEVVSYSGANAAISGPYLQVGMPVVIEGNERLRPEQPVTVIED